MDNFEIELATDEFRMQDVLIDLVNSLSAVKELSDLNCQTKNEKELIRNALNVLIQNQDMERCSFFLLNDDGYLVNLTGLSTSDSTIGIPIDYKPLQFKIGEGVIGIAAQTGELQSCQDCQEDSRFAEDTVHDDRILLGSLISVPIYVGENDLIGVLNISHPHSHYFNEWHTRMLIIYKNMLGQLITNYRLFQEMEDQIAKRTTTLEKALGELQNLKDHFESISMIDQLTGLYNRRYFYEQVELAIANTKRHGQALCLLILDLDQFKIVNDTYGHGFGDEVLKNTSKELKKQVRDSDILVRFGGEEFIVIFTNTDCTNGLIFAERIRQNIESLQWDRKEGFNQTLSIGLYCFGDECSDVDMKGKTNIDKLIHYADTALYRAKELGRNKVVLFNETMLKK